MDVVSFISLSDLSRHRNRTASMLRGCENSPTYSPWLCRARSRFLRIGDCYPEGTRPPCRKAHACFFSKARRIASRFPLRGVLSPCSKLRKFCDFPGVGREDVEGPAERRPRQSSPAPKPASPPSRSTRAGCAVAVDYTQPTGGNIVAGCVSRGGRAPR